MDDKELTILAAAFARSNLGFEFPDISDLSRLLKRPKVTLIDAVLFFCQKYMEGDDHYDMFVKEAQGWKKRLAKRGSEEIAATWPEHMAKFTDAQSL